jgi:hypothetical protein
MRNNIFRFAFIICFGILLALNIYSYSQVFDPLCSFPVEFGFPVAAGTYGGFITVTNMDWFGVFINTIFAITASLGCAFVANKIYQSKNKLR